MKHIPVLKKEIVETFQYLKNKDGYFVDGTLGAGGHSLAIANRIKNKAMPTGRQELRIKIIGIDKDQDALNMAKENVDKAGLKGDFIFVHDDFKNIKNILNEKIPRLRSGRLRRINGALIDLGVSSMQLDNKERGFSFMDAEAKLDMRMDQSQDLSAFDVINYYQAEKLEKIFREYGEEKFYKYISKNICRARKEAPIEKVGELLAILEKSIPPRVIATSKKHYATNVFRALRLEVNQELTQLDHALYDFIDALDAGARLAVISFHSTEDRIVKETFRKAEKPCICPPLAPICTCWKKPLVKIITKKPLVADENELKVNPRSRSAKLRVVERL